jgi:hypothetical protein
MSSVHILSLPCGGLAGLASALIKVDAGSSPRLYLIRKIVDVIGFRKPGDPDIRSTINIVTKHYFEDPWCWMGCSAFRGFDSVKYCTSVNTLRRLFADIGLENQLKDVSSVSLADIGRERASRPAEPSIVGEALAVQTAVALGLLWPTNLSRAVAMWSARICRPAARGRDGVAWSARRFGGKGSGRSAVRCFAGAPPVVWGGAGWAVVDLAGKMIHMIIFLNWAALPRLIRRGNANLESLVCPVVYRSSRPLRLALLS